MYLEAFAVWIATNTSRYTWIAGIGVSCGLAVGRDSTRGRTNALNPMGDDHDDK